MQTQSTARYNYKQKDCKSMLCYLQKSGAMQLYLD